ncbi:hypothetical protein BB561_003109 [Smittium simulii]|uniref:Transcription factor spt8 beta-propeller domain-containing protein n=1 Tax=Smittium simulii TaxID=133385 RepID=A0A2T9YMV5_9FUNG|nr:hypothetical protein BB561_003109 [Smittium simulii]
MEKNIDDEFLEKEFFGGSSEEENQSDASNSQLEKLFFESDPPSKLFEDNELKDISFSPKLNSPLKTSLELVNQNDENLTEDNVLNDIKSFEDELQLKEDTSLGLSVSSAFLKNPGTDDEEYDSYFISKKKKSEESGLQEKKIKIETNNVETKPLQIYPADNSSKITMIENTFKRLKKYGSSCLTCKNYEIAPYALAMINYETFAVTGTQNIRWLFTGGEDGHIYKWDFFASMNGKTALTQWQKHQQVESVTKAGVLASYFYHEEERIPSFDNKVFSPVYSLDVQSEGLWIVSGKNSGDVGMWSIRHDEGRCIHNFKRHTAPVSALKLTYDEYGLISGSWDKNIHLSSISFQPIQSQNSTNATNQTPLLMTTSIDGQTLLWDVRDKNEIGIKFELPTGTPPWALSSCWKSDGKKAYIGRRNNKIEEFDIVAGKLLQTMKLPLSSGPVSQVCSLPNNNLLSASFDNIRIWNMAEISSKRSIVPFQIIPGHHGATISQMYVDESGKYLVTTVGSRGWDGNGSNSCLFYEIIPQ